MGFIKSSGVAQKNFSFTQWEDPVSLRRARCLGQDGQQTQSQKQELGSLRPLLMPVMWSLRPHSYCLLCCIFSITLTKYAPRENLREQGFVPDRGLSGYIPSWQQGRGNWTHSACVAKSKKEMNAGIFQSFSLFPIYLFCTLIPTMVPIKFRVAVPFSINCLQKCRPYAP